MSYDTRLNNFMDDRIRENILRKRLKNFFWEQTCLGSSIRKTSLPYSLYLRVFDVLMRTLFIFILFDFTSQHQFPKVRYKSENNVKVSRKVWIEVQI